MKSVPYKLLSASQILAGHPPTRACSRNRAVSSPWLTPPTVTTARRLHPSTRAVYWIGIWTTPCGTWWQRRLMASPHPARGGATLSPSAPTNVIEMLSLRLRPMKQKPTLSTTWVRDHSSNSVVKIVLKLNLHSICGTTILWQPSIMHKIMTS